MATREQLQEDLSWDIDRLRVGPDEHGSDGAVDVLDDIKDGRVTVERVHRYADSETEFDTVATNDLLRTLRHADGRLALVTWSNAGITSIGYLPEQESYDVGGYSAVQEKLGNEPECYEERATRASAKDMLACRTPDIVLRSEAELLPDLDDVEVGA